MIKIAPSILSADFANLGQDIEKLEIIEYAELRRKISIDGLLGYYGYYELSGFGKVKLMAKGKKHLVLILSSTHEPIVISVDEVGELLSDNW